MKKVDLGVDGFHFMMQSHLGVLCVGFPETHIQSKNNKFKFFLRVPRISLDKFRVV
jgi:hypothetical protein